MSPSTDANLLGVSACAILASSDGGLLCRVVGALLGFGHDRGAPSAESFVGSLIGSIPPRGVGRGAGWAGNIELDSGAEHHLRAALHRGEPVRVEFERTGRIVGP
ncbi:MAG: hypothetical protein M3071_07030 [Actinomycetota bacterium]|nr:hypothetical protein [Actinomycetota bacterium]